MELANRERKHKVKARCVTPAKMLSLQLMVKLMACEARVSRRRNSRELFVCKVPLLSHSLPTTRSAYTYLFVFLGAYKLGTPQFFQ